MRTPMLASIMTCKNSFGSAAWLFLLSTMACGGGADTTRTVVIENVGTICLTQAGAEITIDADLGCVPGCSHASSPPRCKGSFEDGRIVVTSRVDFVTDTSPGQNCPDGCAVGNAQPICVFTVPVEGEVPVVYGAEQATIRLPLAGATPLFGVNACPDEGEE
jgi:hypothetical protein